MKGILRILWFNWRDIRNPDAGGAEVFTHEIMTRLVRKGHSLTLFTSEFRNSPKTELIDGIKIVRNGGKFMVYRKAKKYYESHEQNYDIIIDEINTRPFLTPTFVKHKPILAIFHQLAREFWFYETKFPLNYLGYYYLENKWLSHYRNTPTITISDSSKKDLLSLGFTNILMLPEGLSITPLSEQKTKISNPILVFIGRLKKAKLPNHALEAFFLIKKEFPDAKMWIIGDGYMQKELKKYESESVVFFGHVENEKKYELLSKAHLILVPGVREGWGLIVTEANAMGTAAVAYNVPGLRDSVKDNETGKLTEVNTPQGLAESAILLLKNRTLLQNLSRNALAFSRKFSWETTADVFDRIIKKYSLESGSVTTTTSRDLD